MTARSKLHLPALLFTFLTFVVIGPALSLAQDESASEQATILDQVQQVIDEAEATEDSDIPESLSEEMVEMPFVKLQSLDKVTARTVTFEARVGSTVKFGPLFVKVQSCRKAPPTERPEAAAFLQVWEISAQSKAEWVFSGWMFSSSPGLSSMDHAIYDVWVLDCLEEKTETETEPEDKASADAPVSEGEISDKDVPKKPRAKLE